MPINKYIIALSIILGIASFLRFYSLSNVPPGLWPDEAINANTALQIKDTKNFQLFYPENHGREGLFFLLIAFIFKLFKPSIWSFKLISALIGILTVLGQYLFSLEFFRQTNWQEKKAKTMALLSAFFLATSFWHINFSRIGFRAIMAPFVLVFSFYFFFRGLRTKKIWSFLFSGMIFGIGFYSYISFRLAVLILGFALLYWFFVSYKEKWVKKYIISCIFLFLGALIIALPIGIYFLQNPGDFISRAMEVSVFAQKSPALAFIKSLGTHLAMFNFFGDSNWRHHFAGFPQLNPAVGIFFLVAIIYSLRKRGTYTLLPVWIFCLLLPSMMTIEGIPHALRSICVIPAVYLLSGLGGYLLYQRLAQVWKQKNYNFMVLKGVTAVFLLATAICAFVMYFKIWANRPELENAFTVRFMDVGRELNKMSEETRKFVIKNEGDLPAEVPKFIQRTEGRSDAFYLNPDQIAKVNFLPNDVVIIMNKEKYVLDPILEKFPNSILEEQKRIWKLKIK
jgi:uncharacterized protein YlzI (FlbEa/FlbD family)